jgi:NTE family protein
MPATPASETHAERFRAADGDPSDLSAFNRYGVALALGGGFSRGFAHLGVLEVLEQENIPIAAIVGTSIGSLLGAAYADGIPVRELCDLGSRVRVRDFIRFQRSPSDSQSNNLIGRFVRERLRSTRVEELPIATAIVTTDLASGAPYVFTRGPLDIAVRASCAFPGLFKPVEYERRFLAGGCMVAPVPTAVAAQMNASCVLGVSVGLNHYEEPWQNAIVQVRDDVPRGDQRNNPRTHRTSPSWMQQADIFLQPRVHQIDWTDFSRVVEAHDAGARAMRLALPHVREILARCSLPEFQATAGGPLKACRTHSQS